MAETKAHKLAVVVPEPESDGRGAELLNGGAGSLLWVYPDDHPKGCSGRIWLSMRHSGLCTGRKPHIPPEGKAAKAGRWTESYTFASKMFLFSHILTALVCLICLLRPFSL